MAGFMVGNPFASYRRARTSIPMPRSTISPLLGVLLFRGQSTTMCLARYSRCRIIHLESQKHTFAVSGGRNCTYGRQLTYSNVVNWP